MYDGVDTSTDIQLLPGSVYEVVVTIGMSEGTAPYYDSEGNVQSNLNRDAVTMVETATYKCASKLYIHTHDGDARSDALVSVAVDMDALLLPTADTDTYALPVGEPASYNDPYIIAVALPQAVRLLSIIDSLTKEDITYTFVKTPAFYTTAASANVPCDYYALSLSVPYLDTPSRTLNFSFERQYV